MSKRAHHEPTKLPQGKYCRPIHKTSYHDANEEDGPVQNKINKESWFQQVKQNDDKRESHNINVLKYSVPILPRVSVLQTKPYEIVPPPRIQNGDDGGDHDGGDHDGGDYDGDVYKSPISFFPLQSLLPQSTIPTISTLPIPAQSKLQSTIPTISTLPIPAQPKIQPIVPTVDSALLQTISLIEKYRPSASCHVVGNTQNIAIFKKWVADRKKKISGMTPLILLHGPPGIGKTSIAHTVLSENGYQITDINVSLRQSTLDISSFLQDILLRKTLMTKPTAVILDEIDGDDETQGVIGELLNIFKSIEKKHNSLANLPPIVCIANDVYSKSMKRLKAYAKNIRMFHPWKQDLEKILCSVAQKEKIELSLSDKNSILLECGGDVRRLVGLLESRKIIKGTNLSNFVQLTKKDSYQNIFNLTQYILYSTNHQQSKETKQVCFCGSTSPCYVGPGSQTPLYCKDCPQRTLFMQHIKGPQCHCEKTPLLTFVNSIASLIESDFSRVTLFIQENYISACIVRYEKKQIQLNYNIYAHYMVQPIIQPINQPILLSKIPYQQLYELSLLADTLSDTDIFQKSAELYKDDQVSAGELYSSWLAQSILCYRGGKKSLSVQTKLTSNPDIANADFYKIHFQTKQSFEELKGLLDIEVSAMSHQSMEDLNNTFSTLHLNYKHNPMQMKDVNMEQFNALYEKRRNWVNL
jgi:DNA polymerase III delta prime subunit